MWCCSALHRTFVNPEAPQEQADLLGLPFSTYRAHLREGAAVSEVRNHDRSGSSRQVVSLTANYPPQDEPTSSSFAG